MEKKEFMNIVIVGHVDHGKSTVIGRLLADTKTLPEGKLDQVKENCRKNSKPFEYAFLIDALKDEQSQGITIDAARVFFNTKKRHYIIIDAPGHIEFLKNMITGAARAEAALLVIDAKEGVQENSRRHGYMLSMLGIKQVAVIVNKMDLVEYDQKIFNTIVNEYKGFLEKINIQAECFIPVSAMAGDMIACSSQNIPWFKGKTVLDQLDGFEKQLSPSNLPFRMPVQGVYKFTAGGDDRRIVAGHVLSGQISKGDEIIFYPSGKKSTVRSIESFNTQEKKYLTAGFPASLTLEEQIYVKRGDVAVCYTQKTPEVSTLIKVSLFWLGRSPMKTNREYLLKIGTEKVSVKLEKIERIINASDLNQNDTTESINRHDVAECILHVKRAIAFDIVEELSDLSRFVIVDNFRICGGGIIREAVKDNKEWVRESIRERNYNWVKSNISKETRIKKYKQNPQIIILSGPKESPRKELARICEKKLFDQGKLVYFLGIGSVIHGLDSDIANNEATHEEHLRRLGELANIILDSGMILLVSAINISPEDLSLIKDSVAPNNVKLVWLDNVRQIEFADVNISQFSDLNKTADLIVKSI